MERGHQLDREGIRTDRVKWNLSAAALYEEAVRKQEGVDRGRGAARLPDGSAHRPVAERQVRRSRVVERGADRAGARSIGRWSRLSGTRCTTTSCSRCTDKELYVLDCYAGADPTYRLPVRIITRIRLAQSVLPQSVHRRSRRRGRAGAGVHRHRFAELQSRSETSRHPHGVRDRPELREAARPHRRHELRRRDEEVDLQRAELRPAAQERAVDALLGQHRRGGRRRALLRSLGHGEDDAVERSGSAADRRRRARLERSRRLQLRGRLLREDDQAVGGGRAADLRDDAALRHGARERRVRSGDARARTWTTTAIPKTRARRIRFLSSTTPSRTASAATRRTS